MPEFPNLANVTAAEARIITIVITLKDASFLLGMKE
jgi:hypothetical protein